MGSLEKKDLLSAYLPLALLENSGFLTNKSWEFVVWGITDKQIEFASDGINGLWGINLQQSIPVSSLLSTWFYEEDLSFFEACLQRLMTREVPTFDQKIRIRGTDGTPEWVRCYAQVVFQNQMPLKLVLILAKEQLGYRYLPDPQVVEYIRSSKLMYVICTDIEGKYTYANKAFCDQFGSDPESIIGLYSLNNIIEEDHVRCREVVTRCMMNPGESFPVVLRKPSVDGVLTNKWEFTATTDVSGQINGILCCGFNLYEESESNQYFQSILSTLDDAVIVINSKGIIQFVSPGWLSDLGFSSKYLIGTSLLNLLHTEEEELIRGYIKHACLAEINSVEHRIVYQEGPVAWAETSMTSGPQTDEIILVCRDIRKRKTKELQKEEADILLSDSEKLAKMGGWKLNRSSGEVTVTQGLLEIIGTPDEDPASFTQESAVAIFSPKERELFMHQLDSLSEPGDSFDLELPFRNAMGEDGWARIFGRLALPASKQEEVSGFFVDITEERLLKALKERVADLSIKSREMGQLAYIASHDLKEPIRTILSFSRLVADRNKSGLDEKSHQFLEYIYSGAQRMNKLVSGILQYSSLGIKPVPGEVNLNYLIREILLDLSSAITANDASISVPDLPVIFGYELEIRLLFQNLISNALKFRKEQVPLIIEISWTDGEEIWEFQVQDNGIGISPDYFDQIFGIFTRLHTSEEYEGTGIGLANCHKVVEMHLGQIWVDSMPGKGSSFSFTISKRLEETLSLIAGR